MAKGRKAKGQGSRRRRKAARQKAGKPAETTAPERTDAPAAPSEAEHEHEAPEAGDDDIVEAVFDEDEADGGAEAPPHEDDHEEEAPSEPSLPIPSRDGGQVSEHGGLVFVGVILGLVLLAILAQILTN